MATPRMWGSLVLCALLVCGTAAAQTPATNLTGEHGDVLLDSPAPFGTAGVVLRPQANWPDVAVSLPGNAATTDFTVFGPGSVPAPLFRVLGDGTVLAGASASDVQGGRLQVFSNLVGGKALLAQTITTSGASTTGEDVGVWALAQQSVDSGVTTEAKAVGLRAFGLQGGSGILRYSVGARLISGVSGTATGNVFAAYGLWINVTKGGGSVTNGVGVLIDDVPGTNTARAMYQVGTDDKNLFMGSVGIGGESTEKLYVSGDARFTGTVSGGNIKAKYQDVAEWVPATADLAPGTVVILNPARTNEVMASSGAYDTSVAGVVSAQPGISLGEEGEGKEQIATTGRVRVRVDATAAPIAIGDLLVTSATPGTAMRSEPTSINGRRFHQPGTIIGKALEPLAGGVGEILVLLSLQ